MSDTANKKRLEVKEVSDEELNTDIRRYTGNDETDLTVANAVIGIHELDEKGKDSGNNESSSNGTDNNTTVKSTAGIKTVAFVSGVKNLRDVAEPDSITIKAKDMKTKKKETNKDKAKTEEHPEK